MARAVAVEAVADLARSIASVIASEGSRGVTIVIKNETPFHLIGLKTYFESGTLREPPADQVGPGQATACGVMSKPGFYGVEGVISYQISGGDLVIYFDNPLVGGNRHAVDTFFRHASALENYGEIKRCLPLVRGGTPDNRYPREFHVYSLMGGGNQSNQDVVVRHPPLPQPAPRPQPAPQPAPCPQPVRQPGPCPQPPAPVKYAVLSRGRTFLRSFHGTYLCARPDRTLHLQPHKQAWEEWEWQWLGGDRHAWRSHHNTYLRANPDGRVDLADRLDDWEVWTKVPCGAVNFWRSCHGTFLRGTPAGGVDLAPRAEAWEHWVG